MNDTDVKLMAIMGGQAVELAKLPRKAVAEIISRWTVARYKVENKNENWEAAAHWLKTGTVYLEDSTFGATIAVDVSQIQGMYVALVNNSVAEKIANAQVKMAEAMLREANDGNEWRDGEDRK